MLCVILVVDGTTPLCAAALWGNDAMVAFLLDKGADVTARNEGASRFSLTGPLIHHLVHEK